MALFNVSVALFVPGWFLTHTQRDLSDLTAASSREQVLTHFLLNSCRFGGGALARIMQKVKVFGL